MVRDFLFYIICNCLRLSVWYIPDHPKNHGISVIHNDAQKKRKTIEIIFLYYRCQTGLPLCEFTVDIEQACACSSSYLFKDRLCRCFFLYLLPYEAPEEILSGFVFFC